MHRESGYLAKYGMSDGDYVEMLIAQQGRCAICGSTDNGNELRRFCTDHDHAKGPHSVRGLLCTPCNAAIGLLREDVEIMRRAIDYLERHK